MQLVANGVPLAAIAAYGDLSYTFRYPGGLYEVSWTMDLPPDYRHPALVRGASVELMDGPLRMGQAELSEPDRESWQLVATGICRADEEFPALDASLDATTVADDAVDWAISEGLPWVRNDSLSSTAYGAATTDGLNILSTLLDAVAESEGKRKWVDADGIVTFRDDPTTPKWHLTPGVAVLGTADDEYASRVYLRYETGSATFATVVAIDAAAEARWGRKFYPVDATARGVMTTLRAQNTADAILAGGKARLAWTTGIEASPFELTTAGGVPADLAVVRAGDMLRLHGMFDDLTGRHYTDIVLAEVTYKPGDNVIQLSPMGLAARTMQSVVEKVASRSGRGFRG